jgi:hypothetical protein
LPVPDVSVVKRNVLAVVLVLLNTRSLNVQLPLVEPKFAVEVVIIRAVNVAVVRLITPPLPTAFPFNTTIEDVPLLLSSVPAVIVNPPADGLAPTVIVVPVADQTPEAPLKVTPRKDRAPDSIMNPLEPAVKVTICPAVVVNVPAIVLSQSPPTDRAFAATFKTEVELAHFKSPPFAEATAPGDSVTVPPGVNVSPPHR